MGVVASLFYFVAINVMAIAAFAADKHRAIACQRRLSETRLLWLAALGGSPGALWARQRFRHKTRKQPFSSRLETVVMLQAGIAGGLAFFWFTG